jgi:aerobic-type carbon monoxide dehydrogenase small subunit (CoxS/CutS family)
MTLTYSFWFGFYFFLQFQHTFFTKPSHHDGIREMNAGRKLSHASRVEGEASMGKKMGGLKMVTLRVNGKIQKLKVDPETPLLWVLRDHLGLTGTKFSCGIAECGACTVHVNAEPTLSCVTPVGDVNGKEITTIEGIKGNVAEVLQRAWIKEDVPQCGFCQPGQIMTAAALLTSNTTATEADINDTMSGVLCRCGTYQEIRNAIHLAIKELNPGQR